MGVLSAPCTPLHYCGLTDMGRVRPNNEDVFHLLDKHRFFALADGMGGAQAGEYAAAETVRVVCAFIQKLLSEEKEWEIFDLLAYSKLHIESANRWIYHLGDEIGECKGMGTTLCTLCFYKQFALYAHVGDSRLYLFREGTLHQLTADHAITASSRYSGNDLPNPSSFTKRRMLTQAIGKRSDIDTSVDCKAVRPGDLYLMCTDGLTDQVSEPEIATILRTHQHPQPIAKALVHQANLHGGRDNVTVVVVSCDNLDPNIQYCRRDPQKVLVGKVVPNVR